VQMYFEKLHQGGKPVGEIFKILICLFMAVWITNPIQKIWKFDRSKVDSELFPASEGFLRTKIHKRKRNVTAVELRNFLWIYKSDEFIQNLDDIRSASSIRRELCFDNFYQCRTLGYNMAIPFSLRV
jgi:hypothetical protein